ncbi:unnamed protein product, partial [Mesorhabditis spiculigera]
MGLKEKDRLQRHSLAISEHSLPDRLTQALKALRPGNITQSASGMAPFKNHKNKMGSTVDASDDVVFIQGDKPAHPIGRYQKSPLIQKARSVLERNSVAGGSPQHSERNPFHEPALSSLEQVRNLYKSVPNVNYECVTSPEPAEEDDGFSSTRSPTDSGYRSTPRLDRVPDRPDEAHLSANSNSLGASSGSGSSRAGFRSREVVSVTSEPEVKNSPKIPMRNQRPRVSSPISSPPSTVGSRPERQQPFNRSHVDAVLESRRCKSFANYIDKAVVSRLHQVMVEPLDVLTENLQRLVAYSVKCTAQDVASAIKISFPLDLFASCLRSGQKAASAFSRNGPGALSMSLTERADLCFPVGRFYRYLIEKLPGKPISEHAVVFFTAAVQCILEEFVLRIVDSDSPEVLTSPKFEELLNSNARSLIQYFSNTDSLATMNLPSPISFAKLVDAVHAVRDRILHSTGNVKRRAQVQLSRTGIRSLHYFACGPGVPHQSTIHIADWVRLIYAFAEHRLSPTVDEVDIMQAARLLRGVDCPPPSASLCRRELAADAGPQDAKMTFAFGLIATGNAENVRHGIALLDAERNNARSCFGMCPLAESVVQSNSEATSALLAAGWPTDMAIPSKHNMVKMLLNSDAKMDCPEIVNETPLQISVQQGCLESVRLLLDRGADPSRTWKAEQTLDNHIGSISPVAAAAIRGNRTVLTALLTKMGEASGSSKHRVEILGQHDGSLESLCEYEKLTDSGKKAVREALYYAVETEKPDVAVFLKYLVDGLPWSTFIWTRALESSLQRADPRLVHSILADFGPNIAADLNEENLNRTLVVSSPARIVEDSGNEPEKCTSPTIPVHRNIIDPSYVNSEQLSDIRFQVDGKIVYGHRIVLVNASEKFRSLLQSPDGVIPISDVPFAVFLSLMEFVYTGRLSTPSRGPGQLFQILKASQAYGLPGLETEVLRILTLSVDNANFVELYNFAMHHQIEDLLKHCENYLLLHLPTLCSDPNFSILLLQPPPNYDVCSAIRERLSTEFIECRRKSASG